MLHVHGVQLVNIDQNEHELIHTGVASRYHRHKRYVYIYHD